ncbi:DUF2474 family protein [Sphingopyxis sp. FD7]
MARLKELGWFVAIWIASVLVLAVVGLLIRAVLRG